MLTFARCRGPASPLNVPIKTVSPSRQGPIAPPQTSMSPGLRVSDSPPSRQPPIGTPRAAPKAVQLPLTAEELVNSVMGYNRSPTSTSPRSPVALDSMTRPLPFGTGSPLVPPQSIWSTAIEPIAPPQNPGLRSIGMDGRSSFGQNMFGFQDPLPVPRHREPPLSPFYPGPSYVQRSSFQDSSERYPSSASYARTDMHSGPEISSAPAPSTLWPMASSSSTSIHPLHASAARPGFSSGVGSHHARYSSSTAFTDPAIVNMSFGSPTGPNSGSSHTQDMGHGYPVNMGLSVASTYDPLSALSLNTRSYAPP
jgi:hypothetical protein